jgi:integrase
MANAKKNYKDKYYRVSKRINGKLHQFYGSSKKDAEAKRDAFAKQLELGIDPKHADKTVAKALGEWLDVFGSLGLKESTKERYEGIYNIHIKDKPLGMVKLSDINRIWLQKYFNDTELTYGQVGAIKKLLSKFFAFAVSDGYMIRNPCTGIKNPKTKDEKETEVFTREEIDKILSVESRHTCQIKLMLYTGMRLGEALALTWDDINFEDRVITVTKAYDSKGRLGTPKTKGSSRIFVFPDHMEQDFKEKQTLNKKEKLIGGFELSDLVFPSTVGTPMGQKNFRDSFKRVLIKAGVEYRSPHTLRHTFTTSASRMGIPIEDVAKMLGHSNIKTTREVYLHYGAEDLRKLVNSMYDKK